MKQFFLSFAAMLLIATGASAQQVEVFNNTTCDFDVTVTSYDCSGPGGTAAIVTPLPTVTIYAGNSFVFNDPSAIDFRINVVSNPPALSFMSDTHVWSPSCLVLPLTVVGSGNTCTTAPRDVVIYADGSPAGAFPNGIVYINP